MVGSGFAECGSLAVMGELAAGSECFLGVFFLVDFLAIIINPFLFSGLFVVVFIEYAAVSFGGVDKLIFDVI